MKIAELRQKSGEELQEILRDKRARMDALIFLLRQGKIKNVKEAAHVKKDIARIQTLLNQKRAPLVTAADNL